MGIEKMQSFSEFEQSFHKLCRTSEMKLHAYLLKLRGVGTLMQMSFTSHLWKEFQSSCDFGSHLNMYRVGIVLKSFNSQETNPHLTHVDRIIITSCYVMQFLFCHGLG